MSSYEYTETHTKVCVRELHENSDGCTGGIQWSHTVGEPVPFQLAHCVTQDLWTSFLSECNNIPTPPNGLWCVLVFAGIIVGFFFSISPLGDAGIIIGLALIIISICLWCYQCVVLGSRHSTAWGIWYAETVSSFQQPFQASGVLLSLKEEWCGSGKKRRHVTWLELNTMPQMQQQQQPTQAQLMVNVTVPEGVVPLSHIIIAMPDGSQVTAVVPEHCHPGSVFQIAYLPPLQTIHATVEATPLPAPQHNSVVQISAGKSMHLLVGVPVDSTGDGIADSMGFDTTGDGQIDAIDTTGDGYVNHTQGHSMARVGSQVGPAKGSEPAESSGSSFCSECGIPMKSSSVFCGECGAKSGDDAPPA